MEDIEYTREIAQQSELDKLRKRNKLLLVFLVFFMIVAVFFFIANTKIRNNSNRVILTLNQGLVKSIQSITSKNELTYSCFQKAYMEYPIKSKPYYDKAMKVEKYSEDIVNYITYLKDQFIAEAEFGVKKRFDDPEKWAIADTMALNNISSKNSCEIPKKVLNSPSFDGTTNRANELKSKLENYYKSILSILINDMHMSYRVSGNKMFYFAKEDILSDSDMTDWIDYHFKNNTLVEDVAFLNKLLIDVNILEGSIISLLYSDCPSSEGFVLADIGGFVIPESNYIHLGGQYKAGIFLAAYDSKKLPDVYIGDTITHIGTILDKSKSKKGLVEYSAFASSPGKKVYTGWISIVKPGEVSPTYYNFSSSYIVGEKSSGPN